MLLSVHVVEVITSRGCVAVDLEHVSRVAIVWGLLVMICVSCDYYDYLRIWKLSQGAVVYSINYTCSWI
jgi:hypothetical protein